MFLISRFIMTWVIGKVRATKVLLVLAALAVLLCVFAMFSPNVAGVAAVVALSFCLSLMFPTIYGVALQGLGPATKFGAAGLVMAIVGGAIMPLDPGLPARRDQPGDLVHRSGRLLCRRRQFRRLRPEGDAPQGWRANSMRRYWIITLAIVLAACGGAGQKANFSEPTDRLEVVSWWVSPSEHPAFEVLLNAFRGGNPDVEVIDGAIAGGGGSNVQVALAARLRAGDPPDVWQTFLGSSLRAWVDAGRIVDVSSVYESSGLDRTMPATLLDAATYRVKAWGVPTGSHRGNVLWFSQRVLHEAGVAPPGPGYTTEAFEADLAKVDGKRQDGVMPRRQGQVHIHRAVREHTARRARHRRLEQDSRRLLRLEGSPTAGRRSRSTGRSSPGPTRPPPASRGTRRRRSWRPDNAPSCR